MKTAKERAAQWVADSTDDMCSCAGCLKGLLESHEAEVVEAIAACFDYCDDHANAAFVRSGAWRKKGA